MQASPAIPSPNQQRRPTHIRNLHILCYDISLVDAVRTPLETPTANRVDESNHTCDTIIHLQANSTSANEVKRVIVPLFSHLKQKSSPGGAAPDANESHTPHRHAVLLPWPFGMTLFSDDRPTSCRTASLRKFHME